MAQEQPPGPLKPRNDNVANSPRPASPSNQLHRETSHTQAENFHPLLAEISYPKLPSDFSPARSSRRLKYNLCEPISNTSQASVSIRTPPNIGRRRANAISLINSPVRQSQSVEMGRIFQEAHESMKLQADSNQRSARSNGQQSTSVVYPGSRIPITQPVPSGSVLYPASSRLPPLSTAITATPAERRPTLPEPTDTTFSARCRQNRTQVDDIDAVFPEKEELVQSNIDDPGDWTDDDVYYTPQQKRIRQWLQAVQEDVVDESDALNSVGDASSQVMQNSEKSGSSSSIVQKLHLRRKLSGEKHESNPKSPEEPQEMKEPNPGVLTYLLQPPIRTPKRVTLTPNQAINEYVGSILPGMKKAARSVSDSSTAKGSIIFKPIRAQRSKRSDSAPGDIGVHSTPFSSDSDGSSKLVVRRKRESPLPKPSLNTETDETAVEDGIRNLTPEVETVRKGKGRKLKANRCPSYFDEDIIPSSPAEN